MRLAFNGIGSDTAMMMTRRPDLVVLAAGVASRFGRPKQLEPIGPTGECLMDYGMRDAVRAGFRRVIIVVRQQTEAAFRDHAARFADWLDFDTVRQQIHSLPAGRTASPHRSRPWGTAHAVLSAAPCIDGPFAVMNADDYYGHDAFDRLAASVDDLDAARAEGLLVSFPLDATLSPHGGVSRAVCDVGAEGELRAIVEHTGLQADGTTVSGTAGGEPVRLRADTPVSMNLWLFTPTVLPLFEAGFLQFLDLHPGDDSSEYRLPDAVNPLLGTGALRITVVPGGTEWFGMTWAGDRDMVTQQIAARIARGDYPSDLAHAD